ncbi:MAG: hypothetical protein JNL01_04765 [Bdellovibrionales bacterium]|nr:hypothetical protein [Bdellovibrionales bacterium]
MKKNFSRLFVGFVLSCFALEMAAPIARANMPLAAEDPNFQEIVVKDSEDEEISRLEKVAGVSKSALTKEQKKELRKKRRQRLGRKIARGFGKVSAATYMAVTRNFLAAGGFIRGLAEKPENNPRVVAILRLIFTSKDFGTLRATYKKAGTFDEYATEFGTDLAALLQTEVESLILAILRDADPRIPADQDLLKLDLTQVDLSKLDAKKIRENERFQLIDQAFGPFDVEETVDDLKLGILDPKLIGEMTDADEALEQLVGHLPNWKELGGVFLGEHLLTPMILKAVSQTAGALYTWPLIVTAAGTAGSVFVCNRSHIQARVKAAGKGASTYTDQEQYENDEELRRFCSYVTNQSLFRAVLGREKGYVAGKKFRLKLRKIFGKKGASGGTTPPSPTASTNDDENVVIEDEENP